LPIQSHRNSGTCFGREINILSRKLKQLVEKISSAVKFTLLQIGIAITGLLTASIVAEVIFGGGLAVVIVGGVTLGALSFRFPKSTKIDKTPKPVEIDPEMGKFVQSAFVSDEESPRFVGDPK